MRDGGKFPPVGALRDGEQYWLADGFHHNVIPSISTTSFAAALRA